MKSRGAHLGQAVAYGRSQRQVFMKKYFRAKGRASCSKGLSISRSKQEGSSCFRQYYSSDLSQKLRGGTHSLEMCLMVCRLMTFCNPRAILLRAHYIQGCLNDRDKIIQTEWSLHFEVLHMIYQIWYKPMVDILQQS